VPELGAAGASLADAVATKLDDLSNLETALKGSDDAPQRADAELKRAQDQLNAALVATAA
jgi:hypothetical protein